MNGISPDSGLGHQPTGLHGCASSQDGIHVHVSQSNTNPDGHCASGYELPEQLENGHGGVETIFSHSQVSQLNGTTTPLTEQFAVSDSFAVLLMTGQAGLPVRHS